MSSLPALTWKLLTGLLALALLSAPAAVAQDAEITVVKIKASGTPTGSPQIDSALADLPGIAQICIRFAKCEHEATKSKKVDWGSTTSIGSKSSRVEVTVLEPAGGGKAFKLALTSYKGETACQKAKSPSSSRPAASVSCAARGTDVEYLHFVMARSL